jgi:hypothetical protein
MAVVKALAGLVCWGAGCSTLDGLLVCAFYLSFVFVRW